MEKINHRAGQSLKERNSLKNKIDTEPGHRTKGMDDLISCVEKLIYRSNNLTLAICKRGKPHVFTDFLLSGHTTKEFS